MPPSVRAAAWSVQDVREASPPVRGGSLPVHMKAGTMSTMTTPFLSVRNLAKSFGAFRALHDIDLDIHRGEFVCFLGPSGCGKTTLLRAVAGLDLQDSGTIHMLSLIHI